MHTYVHVSPGNMYKMPETHPLINLADRRPSLPAFYMLNTPIAGKLPALEPRILYHKRHAEAYKHYILLKSSDPAIARRCYTQVVGWVVAVPDVEVLFPRLRPWPGLLLGLCPTLRAPLGAFPLPTPAGAVVGVGGTGKLGTWAVICCCDEG